MRAKHMIPKTRPDGVKPGFVAKDKGVTGEGYNLKVSPSKGKPKQQATTVTSAVDTKPQAPTSNAAARLRAAKEYMSE